MDNHVSRAILIQILKLMNINNLASELKYVNRIGQTLSVEERTSLETGIIRLSHEYEH